MLFMVESSETNAQRAQSSRLVCSLMMRSRIGLPYLISPIWKKGDSGDGRM